MNNVDICTSEVELFEILRNVQISSLQKLIRYWKIIIFADVLLIILNVGVVYYKMVLNWRMTSIVFIIQFLIILTGILCAIALKKEIRKLKKCGLGNEV